jgi:hypothetical protein
MIDALLVKVDKRDASKDYILLALDALAVPPHSIDGSAFYIPRALCLSLGTPTTTTY